MGHESARYASWIIPTALIVVLSGAFSEDGGPDIWRLLTAITACRLFLPLGEV